MASHRGAHPRPRRLKLAPGRPSARPAGTVEPTPSPDLLQPAEWLPNGAVPIFHKLVTTLDAMGYASESHAEALNLLGFHLHQVDEPSRKLREIGQLGAEEARIRNAINVSSRIAQSLLIEFGMTPASGTRIAVPERGEGNQFAKFRPKGVA